jgi:hypothetical protein
VKPHDLNFNSTNNAVITRTLTVSNKGKGQLNGNVGNPQSGPPFEITSGSGAFSLSPKQSKPVTVQFNPLPVPAAQNTTSTTMLSVTSDDPKHPTLNIKLKGKEKTGK